jgi:hypothetical protein
MSYLVTNRILGRTKGAFTMTKQASRSDQKQKPIDRYRGVLIYKQEPGYKMITMMIDLHTPDEQSHITIWLRDLDTLEYRKPLHVDALHTAFDLYHFRIANDADIELLIKHQEGVCEAYYTVGATGIEEYSSFLWLDVVNVRDRI